MGAWLDLSPISAAIFFCVLLIGGYVRGYSGFGFSAILMAGLALILPPAEIVPFAIALEVLASVFQARQVWRDIDWRSFGVILLTGMAGNPVGVWLLHAAPASGLKAATYAFITFASMTLLLSPRLMLPIGTSVLAFAGFSAGIVNGATALSGLVLVIVFTLAGTTPAILRGTLIAYFFATDLWTGTLLAATGLYTSETLIRVAVALPIMLVGIWFGHRGFLAADPGRFRVMTLWLLLVLSALGLGRLAFV